jgi:hypothetical protein
MTKIAFVAALALGESVIRAGGHLAVAGSLRSNAATKNARAAVWPRKPLTNPGVWAD